jgi:hypothetical protein
MGRRGKVVLALPVPWWYFRPTVEWAWTPIR